MRTRFFSVAGTITQGRAFFGARREAGLPLAGTTGTSKNQQRAGFLYGDLEVEVELAALPGRQLAVRVDTQVLWHPPRPTREHVPDSVRTVELSQLLGTEILRQRTVSGPDALHLVDLVNSLPPDTRGSHGCRGDDGTTRRLVITTTRGPAIVTGFFCGSARLVLAGRQQDGLLVTGDLQNDVDRLLGISPPG